MITTPTALVMQVLSQAARVLALGGLIGGSVTCVGRGLPAASVATVVGKVEDLRRRPGIAPDEYAVALGYFAPGDGGGGGFYWDPAANAEDDAGLVIRPTNRRGEGRWRRVPDSAGALPVLWFGARCDGTTYDDMSFKNALRTIAPRGGTLLLPAGRTCLVSEWNFGNGASAAERPEDRAAALVTVRGGQGLPAPEVPSREATAALRFGAATTLYVNPTAPARGSCRPIASNAEPADNNGGILIGPNVAFVTFEDVVFRAGPNLGTCLVNVSHASGSVPPGDPIHVHFRGVGFVGNRQSTGAGIFLSNASYVTIDECSFAGSKSNISSNHGYLNNVRIDHSIFYPFNDGICTDPAVFLVDVAGLDLSDNAFEYGLSGVFVAGLRGGTVRSNWFNGEGVDPHGAKAQWLRVDCVGCVVEGNRILAGGARASGVDGIAVSGAGVLVEGNDVQGQLAGIPLSVGGSSATVMNNVFEGSQSASQTDIVVAGVGHVLSGNVHLGANGHSVRLNKGSAGVFVYASTQDHTRGGFVDETGELGRAGSSWHILSPSQSSPPNPASGSSDGSR